MRSLCCRQPRVNRAVLHPESWLRAWPESVRCREEWYSESCMDAPSNANISFGHAGRSDQVLSCIRPLDAASQRAAGQYGDTRTRSKSVFRALSPAQTAGFPGPVSMIVCPCLSSVLLTSTTPSRQAATTQAAAVTGSRQLSFFVISAQAMRAIRLAMAPTNSNRLRSR